MTDRIIKSQIEKFDLDTLDTFERLTYQQYRKSNTKFISLFKIITENYMLSIGLEELKELIEEYELTVKI